MRVFHEPETDYGREALTFALGAAGGLALGLLIVRRFPAPERSVHLGRDLRDRARSVAGRLRPARLRRMGPEQRELNGMEDAVLNAFLRDEILAERGIDVGAISPGIVELSGEVYTQEESERAVRVANGVAGVRTVVNRMDVEGQARHRHRARTEGGSTGSLQHEVGRTGGMGSRRQGRDTDPDRRDDSQSQELEALRDADRGQWEDEGYASRTPRTGRASWRPHFREDEVQPQDPHGKHAPVTLDSPPQKLNTGARVGEAPKTAERLSMEQSGTAEKPHAERPAGPEVGSTD